MSTANRRRLIALTALVTGLFLGLTLVPAVPTGALGSWVGGGLWRALGVGALGLPLLGIALALAGFDRLPRLDMARASLLVGGISLLAPFVIGVLTGTGADALAAEAGAAPLVGWFPALLATAVVGLIGKPGGVLLAFLALSALTLLTVAWHPLQRLERDPAEGEGREEPTPERPGRRKRAALAEDHRDEEEVEAVLPPPRPEPRRGKARPEAEEPAPRRPPPSAEEESEVPPRTLLAEPPRQDTAADEAQLDRLGISLLETLRTFKVDGTIAGRTSGPVVTQFEVVPAPGVKVGRIMALSDDLAVTMRAASVRVAPIPGKGAVGVEIPNPTARMVTLRELLDAAEWDRTRAVLPVALGRDLEGRAVVADLSKMPHLLIAGATGAGKSVAINTIITALVYRYTPRDLRFLMIDPKMVELSMYNDLPHLRHKVVTNNHDAARVLKWAVWEMNRRYELLHANGARNLADFNRKVAEEKPLRNPAPPRLTLTQVAQESPDTPPPAVESPYTEGHLPLIVVIVDELADLMMTVQGEVETPLAMLAQKARAIGIHLILATQRPSVNVITGLIKANFPSRIAFRVASKVDSRTILDQNGAEALLGNGDMLFLPPGKSEPMRLQGAFIGTEETERVMAWFESRRAARAAAAAAVVHPEEDILEQIRRQEGEEEDGGAGEGGEGERDALFRQAAELCIQHQGGSTSLLQRRLSIGYGRASRILDQLEAAGILAPGNPNNKSRPRDVRIGMDQLDEYAG